ncbi:integrase [Loigolactobacillus backii]|uniref:site-specific integrase n=1 Tax=Loigolactobacillus backii TaxID=375175 RepID=UPI0007F1535E|nr:site-specific integrase [Loigolactobacillus backii]ANK59566.1 integrase [Loigolactobacillus backii]ANK64560.1 integrase [Loigolactobacillus backii]ANK67045.1 integrase [Loigolactobacillus backii]OLF70709.1 integrase [Loigolactobacillus backii]PIO87689.1 integrase [Loigolactobacillus backii]
MSFPYQKSFNKYLQNKELAPITISEYQHTLTDFFDYLQQFNWAYQSDPDLNNILENDIRDYLTMLLNQRALKNDTYNKIMSHLNNYFKFLFTRELITNYPTVGLKGLPKERLTTTFQTDWLQELPELLQNEQLTFYTRAALLLLAKGFTVKEFLSPGFYQQLDLSKLTPSERQFWSEFQTYRQPFATLQASQDLFLKTRRDTDQPQLTLPGLHKYLKRDGNILKITLLPSKLHQGYLMYYIINHRELSDQELMAALRLDPASLAYYKKNLP